MACRIAVLFTLAVSLLSACVSPSAAPSVPALLDRLLPTQALLIGEQHDATEHQTLQRDVVLALASAGRLGGLVMEMTEQGRDTSGLPSDASEERVREALGWKSEGGWPWATYGPVVMAAVRSGAPVMGGNLPRSRMRNVMGEAALDGLIGAEALRQQREAIREGHCGLLPESQIAPMARIQLARDRAMAQALASAVQRAGDGKTVVLVAGNGHVRRDLGVPLHLPSSLKHQVVMAQAGEANVEGELADAIWRTPPLPARDHCAELRRAPLRR
ncbi:MAG: ChaN family lipoprotein [Hydrogenophaga sp.]|uniref:ChaN family lipoprotein n=1 Tax=Hydrogenophaga sp. TaxID=1904254 RepID=UPI003D136225